MSILPCLDWGRKTEIKKLEDGASKSEAGQNEHDVKNVGLFIRSGDETGCHREAWSCVAVVNLNK